MDRAYSPDALAVASLQDVLGRSDRDCVEEPEGTTMSASHEFLPSPVSAGSSFQAPRPSGALCRDIAIPGLEGPVLISPSKTLVEGAQVPHKEEACIMLRTVVAGAMTLLLGSVGSGKMTSSLPSPIPLNHCLIVLDSATYKAIEQDSFLRKEFAITEQRTTTRTDITYTGLYFYGSNTYFEFFDANNQSIGRLGDSAIAFGVDQVGMLEPVNSELASEFSVGQAITRGFSGKQVPWFYMAVPKSFPADSGLRIWIMEYHPRFLSEWNPQSDGKGQGVRRRQVLQRYISVLKETPPKPFLLDVVALTVAVNEPMRGRLIDLGKLFGYRQRLAGTTTIMEGPDIELHLVQQTSQARGVQNITMKVNRRPDKQSEFRFGERSVLKFESDGLARWSF